MRTARRYLAREIYRSCAVVLMALLGLFTFFALVDDLDNVGDKFSMMALLYMQALAIPTRLYDLLPIGRWPAWPSVTSSSSCACRA
jgi:lipopolysaccharide export system permease protein